MEIEKLNEVLKKLESVYRSTTHPEQKKRVKDEMDEIKGKIRNSTAAEGAGVLKEDEKQEEDAVQEPGPVKPEDMKQFEILSKFPVKKLHPKSNDPEVNMAVTYMEVFEIELWGALSDFHLKLDYYHSKERDKYYNSMERIKRFIREYINILNEFTDTAADTYLGKLKLMRNKQSRALLIDSVKFITELYIFLDKLVKDYQERGNIILNPDDKVHFSDIEKHKILNNKTNIEAIQYIHQFCNEFIEAIHLPDEMLRT